ncbi:sucrose-6-phosphate hydrolase [Lactiplantibacillus fabifermentans]|uniref:Sucrose-6-phosphate hydrolase n=1 Tax=Lactiplantibacillus fabifermentans DSM 21115 TaxID=1413187 RepID=A0A0R2NW15_9LACO|nr:sucrose-6-phosphate hydrolase [Lactiplantibacillus fabifermentans]KRO28496.1 beta-fructofuranosidase [Lactiplantibacillus fabifermentans DSM 21115]
MTKIKWTTTKRYQPYTQWPQARLDEIKTRIKQSQWRLGYHIQPTTGLLNDPNGFSYFNGQWHLFYQSFPYGAVHGLKSWVHLVADDLVHWQNLGTALTADSPLDAQGVYSGSAIPVDDQLFLMYTGNVRDQDWVRHPRQNGAWMTADNRIEKLSQLLINEPAPRITEHFRDPQILKHAGMYYALLGAQYDDQTGHVVVYRAPVVTGPWTYQDELTFSTEKLGYMVECPNLVFIDERPVLIFCPQGVAGSVLATDNVYPNAYVIGERFDWDHLAFVNPSPLQNLDDGFDVYATQAFNAPDGRALAVSWIGLPDTTYPSDVEDWANCLSVVKELTLVDGQLRQRPVVENQQLRQASLTMATMTQALPRQSELQVTVPANQQGKLSILTNLDQQTGLVINIDTVHGKMVVDRALAGRPVATDYGTTRAVAIEPGQPLTGQLLLDNSVFELYLNDGQQVLTGRIFPPSQHWALNLDQLTADVQGWRLDTLNKD